MALLQKHKLAAEYCFSNIENFEAVYSKVKRCPSIGALKKINDNLSILTSKNNGTVNEIAEVISRDMSLTSRLLRLVDSVYCGLSVEITSVQEAVFYLGLQQIRQLALTTRIVDEMEQIGDSTKSIDWQSFWRHSIACAIITREILLMSKRASEDDTYYICGLLQNVGKLIMHSVFPDELLESGTIIASTNAEFAMEQNKRFGWNYAQIGALYLELNSMPESIVEAVLFQVNPADAPVYGDLAAGVDLAETITRFGGCNCPFVKMAPVEDRSWQELSSWETLYGGNNAREQYAEAGISNCIERLPDLLTGLL